MVGRKAFLLRIEIDVHSVHYRETRLCHSGNLALRVHALNSTAVTIPAYPSFPIHFHEKLIFEKTIDCVATLSDVEDRLRSESLRMELVQWSRRHSGTPSVVARFKENLSNVLFPESSDGGYVKLLMEPAEDFPDGSGPRVDVSTKTTVEETTNRMRDPCRCLRAVSCYDCCICNSYTGYFHPRTFPDRRSKSCAKPREEKTKLPGRKNARSSLSFASSDDTKLTWDDQEKPVLHRHIFRDNPDYFYRNLRDRSQDFVCDRH